MTEKVVISNAGPGGSDGMGAFASRQAMRICHEFCTDQAPGRPVMALVLLHTRDERGTSELRLGSASNMQFSEQDGQLEYVRYLLKRTLEVTDHAAGMKDGHQGIGRA